MEDFKKQLKPKVTLGSFYRKVVIGFIVLTVLLVFIILYFSFNKAVITVVANEETINADFIATVKEVENDQELKGEDIIKGKVLETELEGEKTFQTTGSKLVESEIVGKVRIINNYNKSQPLIKTTRLLTPDGLLFRINSGVTVPAGGEVEVEVYADDPDELKGKTIEPTKMTIPGLWKDLQDKIYAQSDKQITSEGIEIKAVSQEDLYNAEKKLAEDLAKQAIEDLEGQLVSGYKVIATVASKEVLESSTDVEAGDEVDEFNFKIKAKISVIAFDKEDLLQLAEGRLIDGLPDDKMLSRILPESLSYSLEKYDIEDKTANLKVYLEGVMVLSPNSSILDKERLIGFNEEEVKLYLKSFQAINDVEVKFSPFWLRSVPKLKDHIVIKVQK